MKKAMNPAMVAYPKSKEALPAHQSRDLGGDLEWNELKRQR
jgi:hypothetical protein